MKLIHVGDLHIGKRIYEHSMMESQRYILEEILRCTAEEKPHGILLCGDIYDKNVPSGEAVQLFDWFLTSLAELHIQVFVISGNHDSAERLQFGSQIFAERNVHIAGVFQGKLERVMLTDEWGEVEICLLPYIKPASVRPYFPHREIATSHQAVEAALAQDSGKTHREKEAVTEGSEKGCGRRVLVAHQFVAGLGSEVQQCQSETLMVGGAERVDASLFGDFDYVALGHLHGPQSVDGDRIRYGGSVLKYSFSERNHHKSIAVVELREKGNVSVRLLPLIPKYDLRQMKGPLAELIKPEIVNQGNPQDFLQIILTDNEPLADPLGQLRSVYPNVLTLSVEHSPFEDTELEQEGEERSVMELFEEFFTVQNEKPMSETQRAAVEEIVHEMGEVEK